MTMRVIMMTMMIITMIMMTNGFYMMLNLMIFLREQEGLARLLLVSEDKVGHLKLLSPCFIVFNLSSQG